MAELAHGFHIELVDTARVEAAMPWNRHILPQPRLSIFKKVELLIDGQLVLKGWVDAVEPEIGPTEVGLSLSGRDVTGDLVDCAAAPNGPHEFKDMKLEDFVKKLCAPFKIGVKVECDTGEPFKKMSVDAAETVVSAVEKYTRKRGLLMLSDGIGNVVLTRSGKGRAPGDIVFGQYTQGRGRFDGTRRFSDVYIKGQSEKAAGKERPKAALSVKRAPTATPPADKPDDDKPTGQESRAVSMQGHAQDPDVGRWRPMVRQTRASGSKKDAQMEADWYVRNARGASSTVAYTVTDFGVRGTLWRINEMTSVRDPYEAPPEREMLIAGVVHSYSDQGSLTRLRVTGKEAYDPEPDLEKEDGGKAKSGGGGDKQSTDIDTTAEQL